LPGWQDDSWVVPDLTLDTLNDWLTPVPAAWTGASVLHDDPETGLKYDDSNWYLSDGTTIVNEDPANPGYFYDAAGNWYHQGQPSAGPAGAVAAPAAVPADLTVQHYDQESKRWRRKWGDGARDFEYYHDRDGVWERETDAPYPKRFHSDKAGWLSYSADGGSEWWLDGNQWKKWEDVGKSAAPAPAGQPAGDFQQVMEGALQQALDGMLADSDLPPEELEDLTEFAEETRQRLLAIFSE
jgi:hypothetical protein